MDRSTLRRAKGDLHIDAITRGRRWDHAGPGSRARGRRSQGHPPLRPRLRALDEACRACDRFFRPASWSGMFRSRAHASREFDVDLAHEFFQGFVTTPWSRCTWTTCAAKTRITSVRRFFKGVRAALRFALEPDPRAAGPCQAPRACSRALEPNFTGPDWTLVGLDRDRRLWDGQLRSVAKAVEPWRPTCVFA